MLLVFPTSCLPASTKPMDRMLRAHAISDSALSHSEAGGIRIRRKVDYEFGAQTCSGGCWRFGEKEARDCAIAERSLRKTNPPSKNIEPRKNNCPESESDSSKITVSPTISA